MNRLTMYVRTALVAGSMAVVLGSPTVAFAQVSAQSESGLVVSASAGTVTVPPPPTTIRTEVAGEVVTREANPRAKVLGQRVLGQTTTAAKDSLPVTGSDVVGLSVIGAGAVSIGTVLLLIRRRRLALDNTLGNT